MKTLDTLITEHGVDVLGHLDRDALVPVLAGLQCQGDVAVIPALMTPPATTPVPKAGAAVVRGESGGNTHLLLAEGEAFWDPSRITGRNSLTLGTLTVAEGSTAYLAHPEHAYAGIAPGTYEIRRQREQADEIRLIAD